MKTKTIYAQDELGLTYINSSKKKSGNFDTIIVVNARNTDYPGSETIEILSNVTTYPGRLKLIEDNFFSTSKNIPGHHIFINDNMLGRHDCDLGTGLPKTNALKCYGGFPLDQQPRNNIRLFSRRSTQFWCCGKGAMNNVIMNQVYEPHRTNARLYDMIPFRVVPTGQMDDELKHMYKGKVTYGPEHGVLNGHDGYYFKRFDSNTNYATVQVDGVDYTPNWLDTATNLDAPIPEQTYENKFKDNRLLRISTNLTFEIHGNDFKEYYQLTSGGLSSASISELGLITGLEVYNDGGTMKLIDDDILNGLPNDVRLANKKKSEVLDAELFSHLTLGPYKIAEEATRITISYLILS
jgi:hypothetical protein